MRFLPRGIERVCILIHVQKVELFKSHAQSRNRHSKLRGKVIKISPLRPVNTAGLVDEMGARHQNRRGVPIDGAGLIRRIRAGIDLAQQVPAFRTGEQSFQDLDLAARGTAVSKYF